MKCLLVVLSSFLLSVVEAKSDSTNLCAFNEDVDRHLSDACKHGLEAGAAFAGAAAATAAGQGALGALSAGVGGACACETFSDLHEAWKSYHEENNDDANSSKHQDEHEHGK